MQSASDGAIRELKRGEDGENSAFELISNFYRAFREAFHDEWDDQTPRTSRLVHSAGIVALGYVMELLYARDKAKETSEFLAGLTCLLGKTAWTRGAWHFSEIDITPWNEVQNTGRDIRKLTDHLVRLVRNDRSIRLRHQQRQKA